MERWIQYSTSSEQPARPQAADAPSSLRAEQDALKLEHYTLKLEHNTLRSEHDTLRSEHNSLKQEHNSLKQEHSALKSDHAALQQRHKALADTAEGLRLSCQSAEGRVLLAQQLNSDRMQELAAKTQILQERCVSLGALAEQHRIAHARQETHAKGLAEALAQQEAKHGALMDRHSELQRSHAEQLAMQEAKHGALMDRYADLQKAHAKALVLHSDLQALQEKHTELQKLHASLLLSEGRQRARMEQRLLKADEALKAAQERESRSARDLETLKSVHRSKESDAHRALRQATEAGQSRQRALEARLQRMEASGLDREGVAREIQRASDALCLARDKGGSTLRSSICKANAALLGLRWRLIHE